MKIAAKKRLFWYLKDGQEFDLDSPGHVDMYVQQVLPRGRAEDVREMLRVLSADSFLASFGRIKKYLPKEVRKFWGMALEVLTDIQKKIFTHLKDIPELDAFYLTGGTASSSRVR